MFRIYYFFKPLIPRYLQIFLRRLFAKIKKSQCSAFWPIDESADKKPDNWIGWPEGKKFALILSHDVETIGGLEKCTYLLELEHNLGFRSSFDFVPAKYSVPEPLKNQLTTNGFEIGVHGLYHDGKLYWTKRIFTKRSRYINYYLKEWQAVGFSSPSMHRNLDWIHALDIQYDNSTFDTDPFEPQPEPAKTIFPFWMNGTSPDQRYLEIPYTLPQDFTLFILMKEKGTDIWKKKLDWIVKKGGMAFLNTHPDYMSFSSGQLKMDEYPAELYEQFLHYIKKTYDGHYWHVLPKDLTRFWQKLVLT